MSTPHAPHARLSALPVDGLEPSPLTELPRTTEATPTRHPGFLRDMLENVLRDGLHPTPTPTNDPDNPPYHPALPTASSASQELMSAKDVAALFHVHRTTLYRWAKAGRITTTLTPGGHHRYHRADMEALLATLTTTPS